ncbi:MAG: hypothetical protein KJ737_00650 [Proteobacteria bacterium]|nr:hypothetical protein [Pseudomonadota bacterium]
MPKPTYKLIFKGQLLANANKTDCIESLARLFKKNLSDIESRLFSGDDVMIKKTDDQAVVDRYIKAFHDAGAVLLVEQAENESGTADKIKSQAPPADPSTPILKPPSKERSPKQGRYVLKTDTKKPSERAGRRKKIPWLITGTLILMLIVLTLSGGYFWFQQHILKTDIPQAVIDAENALATKNLVALGHGHIAKAIELEALVFDEPDDKAMVNPDSDSLVDRLVSAGIDPRESVKQLLFSLHFNGTPVEALNGYYSLILLGHFKPGRIRTFMEREYETEPSSTNNQIILFTKQNTDTCEYSPKMAIYTDSSRVVITFPAAMDHLLERLDNKAPAEIPLDSFREYRKNMLASAGIFAPQHADKAATGLAGMFLGQLKEEIGPVQSGFLGIMPQLFPTGIMIDMIVNSNDPAWAISQSGKLRGLIDRSRQNIPPNMPSVLDLYDHLRILGEKGAVNIQLLVNSKLLENIGEVAGEFIGSIFSESFMPAIQEAAPVAEEKTAESPTPFFDTYSIGDLKPFGNIEDMNFKPDWTGGPFGLFIEKVAYKDAREIEITLQAEARQIENIGKDTERIRLAVSSVKDAEGNELLKEETCGKDRNDLPVYFTSLFPGSWYKDGNFVSYRKANAEKKIRLKEGATISQVSQLNGSMFLDLPIRTERILVKAPLANQIVQDDHVRIRFKESRPGQLAYDISGKKNHILAIRALNQDQKVLSSSGEFSIDRFFGPGKTVTTDYQGNILYAEVILVKESIKKEFPFTLKTILPVQEKAFGPYIFMPLDTLTLKAFDDKYALLTPPAISEQEHWGGKLESETNIGPFNLKLFGLTVNPYWGTRGLIKINSPVIPSLNDNLSAMTFSLDEFLLPNGETLPITAKGAIELSHEGGSIMDGVFKPDPEKNYIKGQKDFECDYKGDRPQAIKGKLTLRLPVTLSQVTLASLSLGDQITENGYRITVTGIGRGSIDLAITGDPARIIAFHMFDENNGGIQTNIYELKESENGLQAHLTFSGKPSQIIMPIATQIEMREMPFQLEL